MASRFWVGGTGTWDNADTTHWAATTGAAGGQSVPAAGDTATFDGSSGGGTVTVAATFNASNTLVSITFGAFTGTLDFSANNPNVNLTGLLSGNGTGARVFNMGSGTWTITGSNTVWDYSTTTNLTHNANTSTLVFSGTGTNRGFITGARSWNIVTISSSSTVAPGLTLSGGTPTFATLNLVAPVRLLNATMNVTNAFTLAGSSSNQIFLEASGGGTSSFTVTIVSGTATMDWCVLAGMVATGGATFTATNSFGIGCTGVSISGPSGGGGAVGVIGS